MRSRRAGQESGFALLFVMAAAAIIGIMLYLELPRVAFEAQRTKETVLIAHGEQYQRAIRLFYRRFNRYPGAISDLENTNNIRFLRRRYTDPMTGKDQWRLIHVAGGLFTDSLTMKPPTPKGNADATQLASADPGDGAQPPPLQRWQLQRGQNPTVAASGTADAGAAGDQPGGDPQQPVAPAEPGMVMTLAGQQQQSPNPGDASVPGASPPSAPQPGEPGYVAGVVVSGQPGFQPGTPPQPGQRPYRPGVPAYGSPDRGPLYPPVLLPGMPSSLLGSGTAASNPATSLIDNQLRGASTSSGSVIAGAPFGSSAVGAGIAGVASKDEAEGIKVYKDHRKYNQWEFIYDPRQDMMGQVGAQPQAVPAGIAPAGMAPSSGPAMTPGMSSPASTTNPGSIPAQSIMPGSNPGGY